MRHRTRKYTVCRALPCIFLPGKCTGWGNEGVNVIHHFSSAPAWWVCRLSTYIYIGHLRKSLLGWNLILFSACLSIFWIQGQGPVAYRSFSLDCRTQQLESTRVSTVCRGASQFQTKSVSRGRRKTVWCRQVFQFQVTTAGTFTCIRR